MNVIIIHFKQINMSIDYDKMKKYWNDRYKSGESSGQGAYGKYIEMKINMLKDLKSVNSVVDVGCGDLNIAKAIMNLFPGATYKGLDVSEFIIDRNKKMKPNWDFGVLQQSIFYEPADLVLCLDVLYHILDDKDYLDMLNSLKKSWKKYLVIITSNSDINLKYHHTVDRKFDEEFFGKAKKIPIDLIHMYIFKK